MAAAAREMDPIKGRSHAQKEKWGIKKVRASGSEGAWTGSALRVYCRAVPKGVSRMLMVRIVSNSDEIEDRSEGGKVRSARWSWWRAAVLDYILFCFHP